MYFSIEQYNPSHRVFQIYNFTCKKFFLTREIKYLNKNETIHTDIVDKYFDIEFLLSELKRVHNEKSTKLNIWRLDITNIDYCNIINTIDNDNSTREEIVKCLYKVFNYFKEYYKREKDENYWVYNHNGDGTRIGFYDMEVYGDIKYFYHLDQEYDCRNDYYYDYETEIFITKKDIYLYSINKNILFRLNAII